MSKPCKCKGEVIAYRNVNTVDGVRKFGGIGTLEDCNKGAGKHRTHVQEIRAGEMFEIGYLEANKMADVSPVGRCPDECDPE